MPLILNQFFTLIVKEIKHAADSFQKKDGGTSYCHYLVLSDDTGEDYNAQMCNDYTEFNNCKEGDIVKVKIKTFSRNRYTIESLEVTGKSTIHSEPAPQKPSPDSDRSPVPRQNHSPDSNPNVAGKATSIALNAAVSYFANRPNGDESNPEKSIIALAGHFFTFLTSK